MINGLHIDVMNLVALAIGLFATGALAGLLAGLLGVGGGIIVVPVLYFVLGLFGADDSIRMHIAVGTSFATIIPTAISSARAHARRGAVDFNLLRTWGPSIALGTIIGTTAANFMNGRSLAGVFGFVALFVAADLVFRRNGQSSDDIATNLPTTLVQRGIATMIGFFSSLMGIGGGTLTVPILNWFAYPILRAVGTSAFFGLIIAVPAAIGYLWGGLSVGNLPWGSVGYINVPGFIVIAMTTFLTAPYGTRLAHAVSPKTLRLIFAGFLGVTSINMLLKL